MDGRTAASNNQPSWIGEGFDLWSGYVERSYKSCADDMGNGGNNTTKTGDECWGPDNATMSLGGRTVQLVKDDTSGEWHPKSDDGSRIEHRNDTSLNNGDKDGEYWVVTTANGTKYYFGLNRLPGWVSGRAETNSTWTVPVFGNNTGEPCHDSTFDGSKCDQAWRWNLDYVVDPHGNTMSYWYTAETNSYALEGDPAKSTSYVRGGFLNRIDYGTRTGAEFGNAPMRVVFGVADRCLSDCSVHDGKHWPDTPWDESCSSSCTTGSPTFWTTKRLSTVTTRVWDAGTSSYRDVERWTLTHDFPDPGDATRAGLWLDRISHVGLVGGSTSVPDVVFTHVQMANRVDTTDDQVPPMNWMRVGQIDTETGGRITVDYNGPECVKDGTTTRLPASDESNTLRCYPVWYTKDGAASPTKEYFHKYTVHAVSETDMTSATQPRVVTTYAYLGAPAWHYTDDPGLVPASQKTWSQWRGYGRVGVTRGDVNDHPSYGETTYFRGMDGDHLSSGGTRSVSVADSQGGSWTDSDEFAGMAREEISYDGPGGAVVSAVISDPWSSAASATRTFAGVTMRARYVGVAVSRQRIALDGGRGYQHVTKSTTFDSYGMPVQVEDLGDTSTTDDDQCVKTTYARNTSAWLMSYVSRVQTFALSCDKTPASADDVIGDGRTSFDGQAWGVPPSRGDVTRVEALAGWQNGTPSYYTVSTSVYDAYGRVTDTTDVDGYHTTTDYVPDAGPVTQVAVTNPKGWTTTTDYDPAWGAELGSTDPNGRRTDVAYDGLGRVTSVWLPNRSKATGQSPNTTYAYTVRTNGANAVATSTLTASGGYVTSYDLYDGLLRPRQTQRPASDPGATLILDPQDTGSTGSVVTDTFYDTASRAYKTNAAYVTDTAPSADLYQPSGDNVIPAQTVTVFDGADRPVASILRHLGVEQWRTTTVYGGDHTDVTPPAGGTATSTVTDAHGRTVELRQYHAGTPTGAYDTTRYGYNRKNVLESVTDAAGNTWTYHYDVRGRRTEVDDPDQGRQTTTYNNDGTVATVTDSRGTTLAYTYDELDRKTEEHLGSATGALLAKWTYDTLALGQPTSSTRYDNGNAYTVAVGSYDALYQPKGSTVTIPASEGDLAGTYTYRMTYKVDGSPSTTTVPAAGGLAQETVSYGYDALGEPLTLSGATSYVTRTQYTRLGEPNIYTFSLNGPDTGPIAQVGYYYDETTRRLDNQKVVRETAPSTIADVSYTWDAAGNLTKAADTASGDTQCFTYDYLRRLAQAWTPKSGVDCGTAPATANLGGPAPYWQSYSYDTVGNRKTLVDHTAAGDTTTTYTYPDQGPTSTRPHTLTSTSTTTPTGTTTTASYGYDTAGNTTSRPGPAGQQTLTWDTEGNLATVSDSTGTTTYLYDADGNRLITRDPTGTTLYLPDQELRLTKATGTVTCTRYYGFGGHTVASRTPAGVTWLAPDWQGTDNVAIDGVTQQVTQRRQTPFGTRRGDATNWPNPHGFVGGVNDNTGLVHLGAREYDPNIGRFVSVDPIIDNTDPQQMEGYTYSNNNPTTFVDPDGQWLKDPMSGGGAASESEYVWHPMCCAPATGVPPTHQYQPAPKKPSHCGWWCKTKRATSKGFHKTVNFVEEHKVEIASVAAGFVAGAACEGLSFGLGTVGCAALAGAVTSMVGYTLETTVEHKGEFSVGGLLLNGAIGAVLGAVGGVPGRLAVRIASTELKKRVVGAVENGALNGGGQVIKAVSKGERVNWANVGIAATGGAVTGAAKPAGGWEISGIRSQLIDAGIQAKNVAAGHSDHLSVSENAMSFGYGALGGKLLGKAKGSAPPELQSPVKLFGALIWRSYNPSGAFHDLLP